MYSRRPAPVEPSADARQLAQIHRQLYVAYVEQGFEPEEAMALLLAVVTAPDTDGDEP